MALSAAAWLPVAFTSLELRSDQRSAYLTIWPTPIETPSAPSTPAATLAALDMAFMPVAAFLVPPSACAPDCARSSRDFLPLSTWEASTLMVRLAVVIAYPWADWRKMLGLSHGALVAPTGPIVPHASTENPATSQALFAADQLASCGPATALQNTPTNARRHRADRAASILPA